MAHREKRSPRTRPAAAPAPADAARSVRACGGTDSHTAPSSRHTCMPARASVTSEPESAGEGLAPADGGVAVPVSVAGDAAADPAGCPDSARSMAASALLRASRTPRAAVGSTAAERDDPYGARPVGTMPRSMSAPATSSPALAPTSAMISAIVGFRNSAARPAPSTAHVAAHSAGGHSGTSELQSAPPASQPAAPPASVTMSSSSRPPKSTRSSPVHAVAPIQIAASVPGAGDAASIACATGLLSALVTRGAHRAAARRARHPSRRSRSRRPCARRGTRAPGCAWPHIRLQASPALRAAPP